MPYIYRTGRIKLDPEIEKLARLIMSPGEMNYVISRLLFLVVLESDINYNSLNAAIGVLECVKQEFYRRVVSDYEDQKRRENGEVFD